MTKRLINRDINDRSTWAYPDIPSGVTVVRKTNVTKAEIYNIYIDCIEIQRNACLRILKQQNGDLISDEITVLS